MITNASDSGLRYPACAHCSGSYASERQNTLASRDKDKSLTTTGESHPEESIAVLTASRILSAAAKFVPAASGCPKVAIRYAVAASSAEDEASSKLPEVP